MIPIYIPSRSRASRVTNGTLRELPLDVLKNTYLVVPHDQKAEYREKLNEWDYPGYLFECPVNGIARTRQWIGERAIGQGQDKFLMLDDDLGFLIRKSPSVWNLRGTTEKEVRTMLAVVEGKLDRYACVGISPREGQNRLPAKLIDSVVENSRIIRALGFRTDDFLGCEHGRVTVMEDFDVLLQLLRKGLPNCQLTYFAQGQGGTQDSGGCSDYRDHSNHDASARKLADLHEGFVRLRQKKNKGGGDFGTRTEVTISWKKAFASAKEKTDGIKTT